MRTGWHPHAPSSDPVRPRPTSGRGATTSTPLAALEEGADKLVERPEAHVLIVDDEPATLRHYERFLGDAGYRRVVTTASPLAFIERFDDAVPDVAIIDVEMPALDGIALLGHLRTLANGHRDIPVLVTTTTAGVEQRRRALRAGAHTVVDKPLHADVVLLALRNLLRLRG